MTNPSGERLPHLFVTDRVADRQFNRPGRGNPRVRPVEERASAATLRDETAGVFEENDHQRAELALSRDELTALGTFITLEGAEVAYQLHLDGLQRRTRGSAMKVPTPRWLLMSVQPGTEEQPERAIVWVADAARAQFLKIFEDYLHRTTKQGNPKNQALVANIARIRSTVLDDLWQSQGNPDRSGSHWWELWLDDSEDAQLALRSFAETFGLQLRTQVIVFTNRIIAWVRCTWSELQLLPFTAVPLAEIRRPEFVDTIVDLTVDEQAEYVVDLAGRLNPPSSDAPAVCLLDTGVARTHVLLADSLHPDDLHDVIGNSGFDVQGHGTRMAGLALHGDLQAAMESGGDVVLTHRLESVRILPNPGEPATEPADYGTVTIAAVTTPEATATRARVFCLPVSTDADRPGEPTLWSATLDALSVGADVIREGEQLSVLARPEWSAARLIVVSAGNVDRDAHDHLRLSDTSVIDDPGQAWNALVVGAHTDLVESPSHPDYAGWYPVAQRGELSPHSRTGMLFGSKWPMRPDICLEGGNVLTDGDQLFAHNVSSLTLPTTGIGSDTAMATANATSAATAQASRIAAKVWARYPSYWPETVRGLLVHAAEWTDRMRSAIDDANGKKNQATLLRRYGWGVPREEDVLSCTRRSATQVIQDDFVPFEGENYRMRRLRIHDLPWPEDVLHELGAQDVRLKLTLSYFIEPSPSKRGWRQRYSYASHHLRFELRNPAETERQFIARINYEAVSAEEGGSTGSGSERWLIGPYQRNNGSLHQDIWEGSGEELAACGQVAVYPVSGWWKRNRRKDRIDLPVRYSLLLSLSTQVENIDLYTPIAAQIGVPVAVILD